jgi:type II secretory pathway pseudopilin PulG
MKIGTENPCHAQVAGPGSIAPRTAHSPEEAFTLIETMVVMLLVSLLIMVGLGSIMSMDLSSHRLADYTAAMALVEAKVQDIRAATYKPPNSPFKTNTFYLTNTGSISLDKAGVTFKVAGTIISEIKPIAAGHLVTVTGTFQEPRKPLVVSLQTVVNAYSGGQQ